MLSLYPTFLLKHMPRSRFFIAFSLFSIAVFIGLGTWQLARKRQKERFIADLYAAQTAAPQNVDTVKTFIFPCSFFAKGQFLPDKHIVLSAKTHQGKSGVYVLNVFQTQGGKFILIQRGWAQSPVFQVPVGVFTIEGIGRLPGPPTYFQPRNSPPTYFWIDLSLLSKEFNLPLEPYYIVATTSLDSRIIQTESFPLPSNNHLQYALTWYSLAFILMGMLLYGRKYSLQKEPK